MKRNLIYKTIMFLMAGLVVSVSLNTQAADKTASTYKMKVLKGSKITIEGDSSMHKYHSSTSSINLDADVVLKSVPEVDQARVQELVTEKKYAPTLKGLKMVLTTKNFRSDIMGFDSQFNKTLKAKEHPTIIFMVSSYTVEPQPGSTTSFLIKITGTVNIAGVEKPIIISTTAKVGGESVSVTGQKDLLMTDFMIDPPKLLFVSTEDKVTVKWNLFLTLEPQTQDLVSK